MQQTPLSPRTASFQYQLDASQGFGWARSAWKIFFLFWDSIILFILGFLKIKDYIVFFFTHYTLHFTNKNGARKTVREAHVLDFIPKGFPSGDFFTICASQLGRKLGFSNAKTGLSLGGGEVC